jgi:hypothetical protein
LTVAADFVALAPLDVVTVVPAGRARVTRVLITPLLVIAAAGAGLFEAAHRRAAFALGAVATIGALASVGAITVEGVGSTIEAVAKLAKERHISAAGLRRAIRVFALVAIAALRAFAIKAMIAVEASARTRDTLIADAVIAVLGGVTTAFFAIPSTLARLAIGLHPRIR